MRYHLDSALVVVLRDTIRWESAIVTSAGTLSAIDADAPFNPLAYQRRDRELLFRDLVTAAAVVETSIQVSDVWNYSALKPKLQGPVTRDLPEINTTQMRVQSGNASVVRHVLNASIPYDAVRYADTDLYGRDALIYETLARVCQDTFTEPPISRIDSYGTVFGSSGTVGWSLAEGAEMRVDVNDALPLGLNTLKQPDQNLAERDNQLAGYVAKLSEILKNPFEFALRIYVEVTGVGLREPEVYSLKSADAHQRIWACEPALSFRNRIVYDVADKTLQWFRESDTEVHQPQIVALAIPGIDAGQIITTLPTIPEGKDAQYWRTKAGQVIPPGVEISDTGCDLTFTGNAALANGGCLQPDAVSLNVPGQAIFTLPIPVSAGQFRVSVLMQPNPVVTINGDHNTNGLGGVDGGVAFGTNYTAFPNSIPGDLTYRVVSGDGILYRGIVYHAGEHFSATPATTSFTNAGPVHSNAHQYGVNYKLALPPGPWTIEMGYTNLNGDTDGFGIKGQFCAQGQTPIDVIQDITKQPVYGSNGDILITTPSNFDVPALSNANVPDFNLPIYWSYGNNGQLGIQNLTFRSTLETNTSGSYVFNAQFGGQTASAYVNAERLLPEILRFTFNVAAPVAFPTLKLQWLNSASIYEQNRYIPVKLKQVQVQKVSAYAATPAADAFQGWRQECIERTEINIQQGFDYTVKNFGTTIPTFRGSGSNWDFYSSENWMAFVEIANPRLREVTDLPAVGYITPGRQYEVITAPVVYNSIVYSNVGDRFYGVVGHRNYIGTDLKQVGAFMRAKPGHVGKPALVPNGLYFTSYGTVAAYYDTALSFPIVVTCQPWMVDVGLYVSQSEFWLPETI